MKIFYKVTLFLTFLFFLNGCIEVKTLVTVNPDGSGQMEETVLLNKEVVNLLSQFSSDTSGEKSFSLYNEDEMKHKAESLGENVEFLKGEKLTQKDKEGYRVIYSFKNLSDLKIDENPGSRIPDEDGQAEKADEYISFNFIEGNPSRIKIIMPKKELKDKIEKKHDEISDQDSLENANGDFSKMKSFLKDMLISVKLKVNGKIQETNASYVNGSTVTLLKIDFNKILSDSSSLKEIENKEPESIEELKKMIENIPGINVELNDPVNIEFN